MNNPIIDRISRKIGVPDILELLSERLSGSELNSLLQEVFSRKANNISPALLLNLYKENRFVQPAETDMIGLLRAEIETLQFLRDRGFNPIELSPVAQLGSCAVVSTTDQKKIISATRNTEVLADATNSLALYIAHAKREGKFPEGDKDGERHVGKEGAGRDGHWRLCTAQRHVRTPKVTVKGHTAHFKIGCMVSSGMDTGSYQFECKGLEDHILALHGLLKEVFGVEKIRCKLQKRDGYDERNPLIDRVYGYLTGRALPLGIIKEEPASPNNYYKGIQFKMVVAINGQEIEIADGGFVDWTQQLLGNGKERLLISGLGLELLYRFQNKLL